MKKFSVWVRGGVVFSLPLGLLLSGCMYDVADGDEEAEALDAVSQAINGATAVGVIPVSSDRYGIGHTCPRESASVFSPIAALVGITMDDEDDDNQTKFTDFWRPPSWTQELGAFYLNPGGNSPLRFCRVEGSNFMAMTTSPGETAKFYAVLSLGTSCPAGSARAGYVIDNEDDQNINSSFGAIAPNGTVNSSTTLFFCVFRSSAFTMASFPDLGARYAVFHTWDTTKQPAWVISKHSHYSDDEDDANANRVASGEAGVVSELQKMVRLNSNTKFSMAQVR